MALVSTEEIIPIYDNGLERVLNAVIRYYTVSEAAEDEIDDQVFSYIEYWTKDTMERWKFKDSYTGDEIVEEHEIIKHTLGNVPFIEFANILKKK